MTPLEERLRARLPMTVEAFMAACLYDAEHGYYTRGLNFADAAHPKGLDFTTAPLLSPIFGQTLAGWVHGQWVRLGSPAAFSLLEAGAGNGVLMRDVLGRLQGDFPTCFEACEPVLVETSPVLTALQQTTLAGFPKAVWQTDLQDSGLPTILMANELLDAFPVRQFAEGKERMVVLEGDTLAFSHPDADITREDSPSMVAWVEEMKAMPSLKAALLLDYGYEGASGRVETLQAVWRHTKVSALARLGESDLTAQVDFGAVMAVLGLEACALADLGLFLLKHGVLKVAEATIGEVETASALRRLVHPSGMGNFKVLEFCPHR